MSSQSSQEVMLNESDLIITKTDPKGIITYANRKFMEISAYSESMLLGKPHNLIRHPDMPRGVFRLLWKTLQSKQEFFGLVKNYTADGNYYWVFANITPDYGPGYSVQGYYSVRRQASRHAINTAAELYRQMIVVEKNTGKAQAPDASLAWLNEEIVRRGFKSYEQFVLNLTSSNK